MGGARARGVIVFGVVLEGLGGREGEVPVADAEAVAGGAVDVVHCQLAAGIVVVGPVDGDAAARVGVAYCGEGFELVDAALQGE